MLDYVQTVSHLQHIWSYLVISFCLASLGGNIHYQNDLLQSQQNVASHGSRSILASGQIIAGNCAGLTETYLVCQSGELEVVQIDVCKSRHYQYYR